MRVVIASRIYAPEPAAAAFRLRALARALGPGVEVLTSRTPGTAADDPGVRVRRWPVRRDRAGAVRGWIPYLSFDVPLAVRLLLTRRPDVVVVEPPPTTGVVVRLVCALRRVPYVYYAADLLSAAVTPDHLPAPLIQVLRVVEGWALRGAAAVLTVSDQVADEVRRFGVRDVVVVGTGVDTDVYTPAPAAPGPTFVYAGTMSEVHGTEVFTRAFAQVREQHPSARLVMYGQGTRMPAGGPGIELPGVVAPEVVAEAFRGAAAGLASLRPGSGYEFAFTTKAFAASACGAPVIYAGPGPCAALVAENSLGWAVEWDVDAVAAAMREALEAPGDEAARARRAAWAGENVSLRRVGERGAAAITAVVGRH